MYHVLPGSTDGRIPIQTCGSHRSPIWNRPYRGEECPFVPGAKRLDWDLPDPAGKDINFMRQVRDEIEAKVQSLINELSKSDSGNTKM